jgi:hypothetical protein
MHPAKSWQAMDIGPGNISELLRKVFFSRQKYRGD